MELIINTYKNEDEPQLKQLIQTADEEEDALQLFHRLGFDHAYTAYKRTTLFGALIAWNNPYHPFCTYVKLFLHPDDCSLNVGEALIEKLEDHADEEKPLQTSFWEKSDDAMECYKSLGFTTIRKTFIPTLSIINLVASEDEGERIDVRSIADLTQNTQLMHQLIHLVKRNYELTHRENPIANLSLGEWKQLIFAEDLIEEGSFLSVDQNQIIAYSFLHASDDPQTLELGWCGTRDPKEKSILPELVAQQIQFAKERGITSITGEFDTTDVFAMEVFTHFPFDRRPVWVTMQKERE